MCEAEAIINKKPLTGRWPADPDSLDTLKPNYLLTMKSKIVLPPPGTFRMLTCTQKMLDTLSTPSKWLGVAETKNTLTPSSWAKNGWDNIVLIKGDCLVCNHWQLASVSKTNLDADGHMYTAQLTFVDTDLSPKRVHLKPLHVLKRPIHKLVLLMTGSKVWEQELGCIPRSHEHCILSSQLTKNYEIEQFQGSHETSAERSIVVFTSSPHFNFLFLTWSQLSHLIDLSC